MKFIYNIFCLVSLLIIVACSAQEQTIQDNQQKQPEIYVFDDVEKIDSTQVDSNKVAAKEKDINNAEKVDTVNAKDNKDKTEEIFNDIQKDEVKLPELEFPKYIIQLGAFTSKERALTFIQENQAKLEYKMEASFSEKVQLYVVQLPSFTDREEALKVRNTIWQNAAFKDAFIITVE